MKTLPSIRNLPTKQQVDAEWYRRSYYRFFKDAFKVLEPETELIDNWHIEYICNRLQREAERMDRKEEKTQDLIINIPPRSLKSMLCTIVFNAWVWTRYPYMKFITASYSNELSIEHSIRTRRLIESEWYQSMYSDVFKLQGDQNVKSKFENNKGGVRHASSVGSGITGSGADWLICDDPIKVQDGNSELALQTANDWWTKTMYTRLNDQRIGERIIIMQRVNEADLSGISNDYEKIVIPAEIGDNIQPVELREKYTEGLFSPNRFTRSVLDKTKISIGSLSYSGQYQQRPFPLEGNLIKEHWFKYFNANDLPIDVVKNFRTDSAYGKEESDNSATICYTLLAGNLYIWNVWTSHADFPEFIKSYKDFLLTSNYTHSSKCYFEPKASGLSIIQQLKSEMLNGQRINIIEGESPKDSKVTRVSSAAPIIEAGRVFLLKDQNWKESFIHECIAFPNAEHDDQVDVLSAILNEEIINVKKFSFAFS